MKKGILALLLGLSLVSVAAIRSVSENVNGNNREYFSTRYGQFHERDDEIVSYIENGKDLKIEFRNDDDPINPTQLEVYSRAGRMTFSVKPYMIKVSTFEKAEAATITIDRKDVEKFLKIVSERKVKARFSNGRLSESFEIEDEEQDILINTIEAYLQKVK